jgi:hypothetical protein
MDLRAIGEHIADCELGFEHCATCEGALFMESVDDADLAFAIATAILNERAIERESP